MKFAVFVVMVLGFAVFAGAQVAPTERIEVTADSVTEAGSIVQLRGNVQIRRGASLVTADEADLTAAPVRLELRGNVRLTSEDSIRIGITRRR